jgi:hypothetical protein
LGETWTLEIENCVNLYSMSHFLALYLVRARIIFSLWFGLKIIGSLNYFHPINNDYFCNNVIVSYASNLCNSIKILYCCNSNFVSPFTSLEILFCCSWFMFLNFFGFNFVFCFDFCCVCLCYCFCVLEVLISVFLHCCVLEVSISAFLCSLVF